MAPAVRNPGQEDTDTLHPDDPQAELSGLTHEPSPISDSEPIYSPLRSGEEEDHAREVLSWKKLPWWRRPSPYWVIFGTLLYSMGSAALLAPKVAMYTTLACHVLKPGGIANNRSESLLAYPLVQYLVPIDAAGVLIPRALSGNHTQIGPDPDEMCASDPAVQAVVARLNAVFTTSMGLLSCLTAGWWGSLSDRYGRRIALFVSVFGLFVTESTHIITAWFLDVLPGGYWFPLIGFLFEGLCGSMPSGMAISHAYLADTTDPSARSRYFSLALGLMFTGVAIGPALGGLLIRSTGTILSVFYFSSILHFIYAAFSLFILPEPLTRARARGARLRYTLEKANRSSSGRVLDVLKSAVRFLSPLAVLLPERSLDVNPLKPKRKDWSLFFVTVAYALITSALGSFPYKFQYAAAQFNWTPEITSYYVSAIGATRAFFLTVALPLIIRYFKPAPIQLPSTPDEPLRDAVETSPSRGSSSFRGSAQANVSGQRSPPSGSFAFDLALARVSSMFEANAFLGMAVASTGTLFALATVIGSLSAGLNPAVQALALDIYINRRPENRGEVGKLFGALSVLQSLASQIISPALYGFVYFNTVARFPQAIMLLSMCTSLLTLTSLALVRIPSKPASEHDPPEQESEGGRDVMTPEVLLAVENDVVDRR